MKAKLLLVLIIGLTFNSCKRCQDCKCMWPSGISVEVELCKEDFGSTKEYKDAIKSIEENGCKCKWLF